MTQDHFAALLKVAGAEQAGEFHTLPGERTITLHASSRGAHLNVSKVVKLRQEGKLLFVQNVRSETTVLRLSDVFAGAVEGEAQVARKAGFR